MLDEEEELLAEVRSQGQETNVGVEMPKDKEAGYFLP
jgi:hypothetical protein